MEIEVYKIDQGGPHFITEEVHNITKVISYLADTKDVEFIKCDIIERLEVYDDDYIKLYLNTKELWVIDISAIGWLNSHHYIRHAIYFKKECIKLWELIKDHIDMFTVNNWSVSKILDNDITFDRDYIYVNNLNTHIPFTYDNYVHVLDNKKLWLST